MPALQRLEVRWQVVWGTPPERVTDAMVWADLPLADYSVDLGASFSSSDAFPRARPASGRITIISRNGRYSPSATSRPSGAPDAELLKRRSAIRWQWQNPGTTIWQTRWRGSLTDLEDSGDDQVSARLESAQTQELAARTTIEEGDTTGAALLVEYGVVSAVTPPQDTLLTMPDLRRRRLTIISDLAEVMASWPIELHTSQLCILAPADVTIARMNAAPLLDLSARITGAYQVEACDTMRTSRIRYEFATPAFGQNFDTLVATASIDLAPGESVDVDAVVPVANQNYLWKIDYDSGDFMSPEARVTNTVLPEDATPVPGYGSPPVSPVATYTRYAVITNSRDTPSVQQFRAGTTSMTQRIVGLEGQGYICFADRRDDLDTIETDPGGTQLRSLFRGPIGTADEIGGVQYYAYCSQQVEVAPPNTDWILSGDIDEAANPELRTVQDFTSLFPGFSTPGTATETTFLDDLITVTLAVPSLSVMTDDLRVTVAPNEDSRSARVVIRNVATESGRTWLHWSGAWRDTDARTETFTVPFGSVTRAEAIAMVANIRANFMTLFPGALRIVRNVSQTGGGRYRWLAEFVYAEASRVEPWVVDRVTPPTYRYRGSLDIFANRQAEPGRGGNYIYARNDSLVTDDATASPQEWWRTDDLVSAQRLADTLAIPRTFLRCTVLDWPLVGETTAHTISTCDIIRISFDDPTRNITVEAPFAVIGMQHSGESGSPGQTTLRLLSLTRPPEAPTRIMVNRSGQTLRGSWVEEETIWGSKALGTDVQYRLTTNVAWTDATRVAAGTRAFSGLSARRASGTWEVRLRTVSTAGVGLWSDPVAE